MKKIIAIISIIAIVVAVGLIVLNNKQEVEQVTPVQTEEVKPVQPQKIQPKPVFDKKPILRDENDMPKSDVDVPEIG